LPVDHIAIRVAGACTDDESGKESASIRRHGNTFCFLPVEFQVYGVGAWRPHTERDAVILRQGA